MTEPAPGGGVQRFIGLLLVIAAVLWMAFSGLCAAWMIGGMLTTGRDPSVDFWGWTFLILVVSGFSVAAGFAVFVVGRGLSR
jgi:hypothetical protein